MLPYLHHNAIHGDVVPQFDKDGYPTTYQAGRIAMAPRYDPRLRTFLVLRQDKLRLGSLVKEKAA